MRNYQAITSAARLFGALLAVSLLPMESEACSGSGSHEGLSSLNR